MTGQGGSRKEALDISERDIQRLAGLVKFISGIDLRKGKNELIRSRLHKRLRTLAVPSLGDYLNLLEQEVDGREMTVLLDNLTTNVTSFFREADHFDYLRQMVLPLLSAGQATSDRRLRIWSAACSSGEEPYSLAITLLENMKDIDQWDVRILATDISGKMLARAKAGLYPAESLESMPVHIRRSYFTPLAATRGKQWQVNPQVQRYVTFVRHNLLGEWPMHGPFQIIFCRNAMIYFDMETQRQLLRRFWTILEPGGLFFNGHSEVILKGAERFDIIQPSVYRKSNLVTDDSP